MYFLKVRSVKAPISPFEQHCCCHGKVFTVWVCKSEATVLHHIVGTVSVLSTRLGAYGGFSGSVANIEKKKKITVCRRVKKKT